MVLGVLDEHISVLLVREDGHCVVIEDGRVDGFDLLGIFEFALLGSFLEGRIIGNNVTPLDVLDEGGVADVPLELPGGAEKIYSETQVPPWVILQQPELLNP